jgi:Abortive infection bacteriophage resistance protein
MDKPFKTFDEQVAILNGSNDPAKTKRMNTDDDTIIHLMRDNYYSVINFYKEPFIMERDDCGGDVYIPDVHFNELKALHDFDADLRILFFNCFTKIEKFFKTSIAYYFSKRYGRDDKDAYLNPANYTDNLNDRGKSILIKLYGHKINKKKEIINHYSIKDNTPLWITIHFLTLGNISILFNILKLDVQQDIKNHFEILYKWDYGVSLNLKIKTIKTFLNACSLFRNVSAHNERFYNFTLRGHIAGDRSSTNNQKLFALYKTLKFFLPKDDYDSLTDSLKELMKNLKGKLHSICLDKILIEMDFPDNWL